MRFRLPRTVIAAALFYAAQSGAAVRPFPEDVSMQAFARPSGQTLQLLVRAPMAVLNDIQFPVRENGYLDLPGTATALPGAARYRIANSIDIYENGMQLPAPRVVATRVALQSDNSFGSIDEALAHLRGPELDPSANALAGQASFDMLFEYPIHSDRDDFSFRTRFAHLGVRVSTSVKFGAHSFSYSGDPGLIIVDPKWSEDVSQFVRWGFGSFLDGTDYLLLVFCLVLPFRRVRDIVSAGAAFASAIPITLIASACGMAPDGLWFRPLIDTLVAITILYTALANIAGGITPYRRSLAALIFGLVFGFSFSFGLASKGQFAGGYPLLSAVSFNIGVELALLLVLAVLVPVLYLLCRFSSSKRIEAIVLSVLAAHTAWHWMTERWDRLSQFPLRWPVLDAALLAAALQWMMILVIFSGAVWFVSRGWT